MNPDINFLFQVIAVAKSSDLVLMVLDASKVSWSYISCSWIGFIHIHISVSLLRFSFACPYWQGKLFYNWLLFFISYIFGTHILKNKTLLSICCRKMTWNHYQFDASITWLLLMASGLLSYMWFNNICYWHNFVCLVSLTLYEHSPFGSYPKSRK